MFSLRQDVGLALVTRETVYPQWNPSFSLICCCQIQTKPSFHTFWGSYNEPSHGGHKIFRQADHYDSTVPYLCFQKNMSLNCTCH